jgi:predicted N-acyltransferase
MQLVGKYDIEINPILLDLEAYFEVSELLEQKHNAIQIKNAQAKLTQIKRESVSLDKLKEDVEYYKGFNDELKLTIGKLIDIDRRKVAGDNQEIQELKRNEISSILFDYIYNYYDYANYPYLSNTILEIIKRKSPNPDADVSDLLTKL